MSTSTWIIGVMAATAMVGLALILLIKILSPSAEASLVGVPDVSNTSVEAATAVLEGLGFLVDQSDVPDPDVPVGLVAGTDPAQGTELATGSTVTLLVSTGPSSVDVPNLLNLTLDDARSAILAAGLTLGDITTEVSTVVPADTVLGQDPPPGTTVDAGTTVDIVVSAGTDAIEMPDVVGKSQAEAVFQLGEAGFTSEQIVIEEQASTEVLAGFVIETIPTAGNQVAGTSTITVIVSSGAEPVDVPDVVGMDLTTATAVLQADGLVVQQGDVIEVPFGDDNDGKVMEQDPEAGTQVEVGDTVTLRVGASGEPVDVPDLIDFDNPLTLAQAESILTGLGLTMRQGPDVEVDYGSPFAGHVSEQSPPPGTQVAPGDEVVVSLGQAPAGVIVPDVVGNGQTWLPDQVDTTLTAAGLHYVKGDDVTVLYGDACDGFANTQTPAAGTEVAPNEDVTVRFCKQESGPRAPYLIGKTKTQAETAIANVGLNPVYEGLCDPGGTGTANRVVLQDPRVADNHDIVIVNPGSDIRYWIYRAGEPACPALP